MTNKHRCPNCGDYFTPKQKYPEKFCSDKCKKEAIERDHQKKYQKAIEATNGGMKYRSTVAATIPIPKKNKKKSPHKIAKEAAWDQFSIYIRTRDCIRFTGTPDNGKCVTCDRPYLFKKLQAGHFIQGRGNSVLFDERIVYSQCGGCNTNPPIGKGGNYVEYFIFMEHEWGREKIDEFRKLKYKIVKYTTSDLIEIKKLYVEKTKSLMNQYEIKQLRNY